MVQWKCLKDKYLNNPAKEPEPINDAAFQPLLYQWCIPVLMSIQLGHLATSGTVAGHGDLSFSLSPATCPLTNARTNNSKTHYCSIAVLALCHEDGIESGSQWNHTWSHSRWLLLEMTSWRTPQTREAHTAAAPTVWGHGFLIKTRLHVESHT